MKKPDSPLSKLIRVKRVRSGLRQEDLAKLIGKSRSWVALLENGHIEGIPEPALLHRLSEALHLDDETLLSAAGYLLPLSTKESTVITMTKAQAEAAVTAAEKKMNDVKTRLSSNHQETQATQQKLSDLEADRTALLQKKAAGEDVENKLKALRPVATELFSKLDELTSVRGFLTDSEAMAVKDQEAASKELTAHHAKEELAAAEDIAAEMNLALRKVEKLYASLLASDRRLSNLDGSVVVQLWMERFVDELHSHPKLSNDRELLLPIMGQHTYL